MATRSSRISKVIGRTQRAKGTKNHPVLGPVKGGGRWDGAMRGVPLLGPPMPKRPRS
jgi:hypothetical protein